MTRLSVESRLTEKIRDVIRARYDHNPAFYDYPGPVLFMMALDISNASQSFGIDGAQTKLDELKLESYRGEDITAKFCATECEQFNRQVYAMLDMVKKIENKYKLADLKSITTHQDYSNYGPISRIAWLKREHTDLLKYHYWPALASKLPQSNYVSKHNGGSDLVDTRTCYNFNKEGHIANYCP
jgi:hypothetical protein